MKKDITGLVEGIICYDANLTIAEVEAEWKRIGLGKFIPDSRLSGVLLFFASNEDIVLCQRKIRDGDTELFTTVGLNRKVKMC